MAVEQGINVDKLERELATALEADRKYSRENDAKFRAIHQKVQSYEEFRESASVISRRDIVKASHLQPLDRNDLTGKGARKQPWNSVAAAADGSVGVADKSGGGIPTSDSNRPGNVQEFMREWRRLKRLSVEQQYLFLLNFGGSDLYSIFKVDISMGLLGEIIEVLNKCFVEKDRSEITCILSQLSNTSRFNLSVSFLSQKEKLAVTELFKKLSPLNLECNQGTAGAVIAPTSSILSTSELARLYAVNLDT